MNSPTIYIMSIVVLLVVGVFHVQQVEGYTDWYSPEYDELRVKYVEAINYVERPLGCHDERRHARWAFTFDLWKPVHSGVVLTLLDGTQWLMERHGNGPDSNTTMVTNIANIQHPCPHWVQKRCRILRDPYKLTVNDFWNASYPYRPYSKLALFGSVNCHVVSQSLWNLTINYSDPCYPVDTAT